MTEQQTEIKEEQQEQPLAASATTSIGKPALDEVRGKHAIERVPGVHLDLKLGAAMRLRLLCVEQRYEAKVVGFEPYEYIIVQLRLPQDTVAKLRMNPGAVAQVEAGGTLYGFRTEVLSRVATPAQLLFLSYPATVERVALRRGSRLKVSIPANVHGSFGDHDVLVMDLTTGGCRFCARSALNNPLRSAQPGERVLLRCELGSTCGKPFMAPLVLRRVDEASGRITMGGQFVDLAEENAGILSEYMDRLRKLGFG